MVWPFSSKNTKIQEDVSEDKEEKCSYYQELLFEDFSNIIISKTVEEFGENFEMCFSSSKESLVLLNPYSNEERVVEEENSLIRNILPVFTENSDLKTLVVSLYVTREWEILDKTKIHFKSVNDFFLMWDPKSTFKSHSKDYDVYDIDKDTIIENMKSKLFDLKKNRSNFRLPEKSNVFFISIWKLTPSELDKPVNDIAPLKTNFSSFKKAA